jgi:hypothetical protein
MIIPDRIACGSQNEDHWSCRVFSMVMTSGKRKLDWIGMTVWKIFSDEGCSLKLTEDMEARFLEYLNLDSHRGKGDDWKLA